MATRARSAHETVRSVAFNFEVRTMNQAILQQTEDAIAAKIIAAGQPMATRTVLEEIVNETSLDEFELRAAIWRLIGRGKIELTKDRKLAPANAD